METPVFLGLKKPFSIFGDAWRLCDKCEHTVKDEEMWKFSKMLLTGVEGPIFNLKRCTVWICKKCAPTEEIAIRWENKGY